MKCDVLHNLCAVQGDTKTYSLKFFKDGSTPYDITGATVEMTIRISADSTIHKLANITSPTQGEAEIELTASDTDVPLGQYRYDIQISSTELGVKTVMRGFFKVVWQVTEDE